jgi:hypothetical protein
LLALGHGPGRLVELVAGVVHEHRSATVIPAKAAIFASVWMVGTRSGSLM